MSETLTKKEEFLREFYAAKEVPYRFAKREKRRDENERKSHLEHETKKTRKIDGQKKERKIGKQTWIGLLLLLLAVPITIYAGMQMEGRSYYFISLMLIIYAMIPFFMIFEGRRPQVRELVLLASLVALTVVGRGAFYMLPNFKPVIAMVIISGVAYGAETGFLVGALSMMVSNFLFGQGPWTPWQMFAMGMIGFLSGLFRKLGWISERRLPLCLFGFLMTLFVYGGIMNPSSVLLSFYEVTWETLLASYISGLPVDLVHAVSTVLFLWIGAKPLLEKLERIRIKYGLIL